MRRRTPGVAAVALHARTAAQRYSGTADWSAIARLRDALPADCPVLGNGDIWAADGRAADDGRDRLRRRRRRARLPGPAVAVRRPGGGVRRASAAPRRRASGEVVATMRRHAELLCAAHRDERKGVRDIRKHVAWYLKGFPVGAGARAAGLAMVDEPRRAGRAARRAGPATSPSRPTPTARADDRARRAGWCSRRGGWTTRTTRRCRWGPSWSTPEADRPRSLDMITIWGAIPGGSGRSARQVGDHDSVGWVPGANGCVGIKRAACRVDISRRRWSRVVSVEQPVGVAAQHTAAAEELAALGRWEEAYKHLRAAVRLLHGSPSDRAGPPAPRARRGPRALPP